jgi:TatD related DNase
MMLIDHHCHLDFPDFASDLDGVVARANAAGVGLMVTISTHIRRFDQIRAIAERYPTVYASVGTPTMRTRNAAFLSPTSSRCRTIRASSPSAKPALIISTRSHRAKPRRRDCARTSWPRVKPGCRSKSTPVTPTPIRPRS